MTPKWLAIGMSTTLLQITSPAHSQSVAPGPAVLEGSGTALAATAAEETAAPVWQSNDAAWSFRYSVARQRLLGGDFAEAQRMFDELVRTATYPSDRALAAELGALARTWANRDLTFIRRGDLGESQLSAKAMNERTTDEIAVLYGSAALYGLGTGGWLAVQTEPSTAAGGVLPALGFAAAAAGAVALVDHHQTLHYGVPQSIVSGMYIGLQEGVVWAFWNQARTRRADEWSARTVASVIWGMSTAGALAGGVVGQWRGSTPGRASFVGSAALWSGLVSGLAVGALSGRDDAQDDRALLAGAVGLNAGAVLGAIAAGPVSPSIARVRILDLGAIGGSVLFGGLYLAIADKRVEDNGMMGSIALGAAAGLSTSWFATAGMSPDRPETATQPGRDRAGVAAVSTSVLPTRGGAMLAVHGEM